LCTLLSLFLCQYQSTVLMALASLSLVLTWSKPILADTGKNSMLANPLETVAHLPLCQASE
jgi:hypothetical protein